MSTDRDYVCALSWRAARATTHPHMYWPQVKAMINRFRACFAAEPIHPLYCFYGVALVGFITAVGEISPSHVIKSSSLVLMYLFAALVVAIRFGLWPSLVTAVFSVATIDYLFIPPLYSFEINNLQDVLLLAIFSAVSLIASGLAARLRNQVAIADRNAQTTAALYEFAEILAGEITLDAITAAVVDKAAAMLDCDAAIFVAGTPPPPAPLTLTLRSAGDDVGLMTVTTREGQDLTGEQRRLLDALAELAGIALGRQILADRLAQQSVEKEADRLRSALLDSIAHDLTSPIVSVATGLSNLIDQYDAFDDSTRRELIAEAEREASHLHRFSANLIHIARVEAGVVQMQREPTDVADLVGSVLVRADSILTPRTIDVDIPSGLPQVVVDFTLMEQAIFHILENAAKYTPPTTTVTITGKADHDGVSIEIADDGPGFPAEDSQRIFSKFYRASAAINETGTGLGLAICRGFIEAHGGTITAKNRSDRRGAIFTITLPLQTNTV